jgi:Tfp pilus assembly protein PilN
MDNIKWCLFLFGLVVVLFCAGLGAVSLYDRWQISLAAKPLISTVIPAD